MNSSSLFEASQASGQPLQKAFNNIIKTYVDHVKKNICHYNYIITVPLTQDKPDLTI